MALKYTGKQSPLERPVSSPDEVEAITRSTVVSAVEDADETLASIARDIEELTERAARVTEHRDHLLAWLRSPRRETATVQDADGDPNGYLAAFRAASKVPPRSEDGS